MTSKNRQFIIRVFLLNIPMKAVVARWITALGSLKCVVGLLVQLLENGLMVVKGTISLHS
jgi:hypothetical protein